ncbi:MAG: PQQ-binding-like beta-propeller repeat protein [Marinisporobacter sp.]|nr:PQQ-binding-like beta-propeller repeat protein [Marinisporobacter sp.]
MVRRRKSFAISLVVVMLLTLMPMSAFADWEQFQGDIKHNGVTTDNLPISDSVEAWATATQSGGWFGVDVVPLVIGNDTYVFANSKLYKMDVRTGDKEWEVVVDANGGFQLCNPATDGSNIYLGADDGSGVKIKKISNLNGTPKVTDIITLAEGGQLNTPITYKNGKLYFGSWKGTWNQTKSGLYYCVDASSGHIDWKYTGVENDGREDGFYWAGAAIVGDNVIFGNDASYIHVLNKNNGKEEQKIDLKAIHSDAAQVRSSICVYDNSAYFTDKSGYLWKLDIDGNGKLTYDWSKKLDSQATSTPVVAYHKDFDEDRIYVGVGQFSGGKIVCYDTNGNLVWEYAGIGGVQSSPIVYSDDVYNYIYFTENSAKGKCYCIMDDGLDASLVWDFTPAAGQQNYTLQGMAPAGEYVIFGNDSGYVFGIKQGIVSRALAIELLQEPKVENVTNSVYGKDQ